MLQPGSVAEAIAALAAAFDDVGVRWYLFGAQAALLYGSARLTADVDVTVILGEHPPEELLHVLTARGFEPTIDDAPFIAQTRVLPVVHMATSIPADIVLGGPGLEELFQSRAQVREFASVRIPVARAEDLIVMKILAGRDKDREDVLAIVRAQGNALDRASIEETLVMLEEALGQSDLLPVFVDLVGR